MYIYIYIYIYILSFTDWPVSFYQNSSVWLNRLDSRYWDRNPVDSNANPRFYHSATRKPAYVYIHTHTLTLIYIYMRQTYIYIDRYINYCQPEEFARIMIFSSRVFFYQLSPSGLLDFSNGRYLLLTSSDECSPYLGF